ncbi:hypothetical protein HK100_012199 [Physocladia obscura]|uniref:Uncharacterized protein n=1 Tax=Physocladia obscura TaxID=109957 RepID=A0AAD5T654_9FUNG|nr:hypothetical protein HK100_012199 [Physocladia obscura]
MQHEAIDGNEDTNEELSFLAGFTNQSNYSIQNGVFTHDSPLWQYTQQAQIYTSNEPFQRDTSQPVKHQRAQLRGLFDEEEQQCRWTQQYLQNPEQARTSSPVNIRATEYSEDSDTFLSFDFEESLLQLPNTPEATTRNSPQLTTSKLIIKNFACASTSPSIPLLTMEGDNDSPTPLSPRESISPMPTPFKTSIHSSVLSFEDFAINSGIKIAQRTSSENAELFDEPFPNMLNCNCFKHGSRIINTIIDVSANNLFDLLFADVAEAAVLRSTHKKWGTLGKFGMFSDFGSQLYYALKPQNLDSITNASIELLSEFATLFTEEILLQTNSSNSLSDSTVLAAKLAKRRPIGPRITQDSIEKDLTLSSPMSYQIMQSPPNPPTRKKAVVQPIKRFSANFIQPKPFYSALFPRKSPSLATSSSSLSKSSEVSSNSERKNLHDDICKEIESSSSNNRLDSVKIYTRTESFNEFVGTLPSIRNIQPDFRVENEKDAQSTVSSNGTTMIGSDRLISGVNSSRSSSFEPEIHETTGKKPVVPPRVKFKKHVVFKCESSINEEPDVGSIKEKEKGRAFVNNAIMGCAKIHEAAVNSSLIAMKSKNENLSDSCSKSRVNNLTETASYSPISIGRSSAVESIRTGIVVPSTIHEANAQIDYAFYKTDVRSFFGSEILGTRSYNNTKIMVRKKKDLPKKFAAFVKMPGRWIKGRKSLQENRTRELWLKNFSNTGIPIFDILFQFLLIGIAVSGADFLQVADWGKRIYAFSILLLNHGGLVMKDWVIQQIARAVEWAAGKFGYVPIA